jgi:Putative lactococcus lactis phage r1t holin
MFSLYFWKAAAERAVKSFAQTLVALLGVGQVGLLDVDWLGALSIASMATLLSVLSSIGSAGFGESQDPSLVPTKQPEARTIEPDAAAA